MCGRFSLTIPPEMLREVFGLAFLPDLPPRTQIAPTEEVLIVRSAAGSARGRSLLRVRWGVRAPGRRSSSRPIINARQETVFEKPLFRVSARLRRCLVPADAFYEWKKEGGGRGRPFRLRMKDGRPFAIAGLFEPDRSHEGGLGATCVLLTTEANGLVAPIHDRMPVILSDEAHALWLDPAVCEREALEHLFRPFDASRMTADPLTEQGV